MFSISFVNAAGNVIEAGSDIRLTDVSGLDLRLISDAAELSDAAQIRAEIVDESGGVIGSAVVGYAPVLTLDALDLGALSGSFTLRLSVLDADGAVSGAPQETGLAFGAAPAPYAGLRLEAEDATLGNNSAGTLGSLPVSKRLSDGDIGTDAANADAASGDGYVDFGGGNVGSGEFVEFTFTVPTAGEYDLAIGYALGSGSANRSMRLDVNGELADRIFDLTTTSSTTAFDEYGEATIRVTLEAGTNMVRLSSNGFSGPNIDYLDVKPIDPNVFVFQAEDLAAATGAGSIAINRAITPETTQSSETFRVGAEGGAYLDWAQGSGASTQIADFTFVAPGAGTYAVSITYATGSQRPLDLKLVDGGVAGAPIARFTVATTVAPSALPDDRIDLIGVGNNNADLNGDGFIDNVGAQAWEGWTTETLQVTLAAGDTTLRLQLPSGGTTGPNIDKIEVALVSLDAVPPGAVSLVGDGVAENDAGAVIGRLDITDADGGSYNFAVLDEGAASTRFEVTSAGVLKLIDGVALDFETTGAAIPLTLRVTDENANVLDTPVTIVVGDIEEVAPDSPPTLLVVATPLDENTPAGEVATFIATDDGTVTVSLTDARFEIVGGAIVLKSDASLDHESDDGTLVTVTATDDSGKVTTADLTLSVMDVNEAPTLTGSAAAATVPATGGIVPLGGLTVSDPEGDATTLELGAGSPAGFSVDANGDLVVAESVVAGTYEISILANDGALESQPVVVSVTVDEPPIVTFQTLVIEGEDFAIVNPGDTSLARTRDGNQEQPGENSDGTPNGLAGNNTGLPNFDKFGLRPGYSGDGYLDINGTDTGPQIETTFDAPAGTYDIVVRLAANNNRPIDVIVDGQTLPITSTVTTQFYLWETRTVTVTLDTGGSHTLAISQTGGTAPNIDAVAIAETGTSVDFNAPEIDASDLIIAETTTDATAMPVVDFDGSTVTFGIAGGADQALFTIDETTGVLSFIEAPDFESPVSDDGSNVYQVLVSAVDETGDATVRMLAVTVTDVNEAPVISSAAAFTIAENTTAVGRVLADDPDGEAVSFELSGIDADKVSIDSEGNLTLNDAPDFEAPSDAGADGIYDVTVEVTGDGQTVSQDVSIEVTDVDPELVRPIITPVIIQSEEMQIVSAPDGTVHSTQTDSAENPTSDPATKDEFFLNPGYSGFGYSDFGSSPGDAVVWSVSVAEAGLYDLSIRYASSGPRPLDLVVGSGSAVSVPFDGPNFNTWSTLTMQVELAEGPNTISLAIPPGAGSGPNLDAIALTTVGTAPDFPPRNEAPVFDVDPASVAVDEETGGVIGAFVASDDPEDTVIYSLEGDDAANFTISASGDLSFAVAPDFEAPADADGDNVYEVTVIADDGKAPAVGKAVDITVADVDEPVTGITLTAIPVTENKAGVVVADIFVTDPDAGATYAATDLALAGADAASFEIIDGASGPQLRLKDGVALDFEAVRPVVEVTLADGSLGSGAFSPDVGDVAEGGPVSLVFDAATVVGYSVQDKPGMGGSGVGVADEGASLTLDGNLWKRAPLPENYTITEQTRLTLTVEVSAAPAPEIVAIGFDSNESPWDGSASGTIFQVGGTQRQNAFVELRGTDSVVDNGDGTLTVTVDLSARAGTTIDSLVFIADDDVAGNGLGEAVFSNVVLIEDGMNSAPVVVGGGTGDLVANEGAEIEIDLAFIDPDGDPLSYAVTVSDGTGDVTGRFPDIEVVDGVLSGSLGDAAPGIYTITVTASDPDEASASDSFILEVLDVNETPVAEDTAFEPIFETVGTAIAPIDVGQFTDAFSDPDGDPLVFSVEDLPAGLSLDEEGVITGTPLETGNGSFTLVATDTGGLSASIEIALIISAPQAGDVTIIEAEDFTGLGTATNFIATGQAGASENGIIRASNASAASAVTTDLSLNGLVEGFYTVSMTRYDETDGSATYSLSVGDTVLADNEAFDAAGNFDNGNPRGAAGQSGNLKTVLFDTPVFVTEGTILTLSGQANGELLRVDKFAFTRVDAPNTAPGAVSLEGGVVAENLPGAALGTLSATDAEGDALTFSVDPASLFEVSEGDQLRLKEGASLDFETGEIVEVQITATDARNASSTSTVNVTVTDVDEAPAAVALDAAIVAENVVGAVIGTLSALDPEAEAVTFSVEDPRFEIEGSSLKLAEGVSLDHEAGASMTVAVTAADPAGNLTVTDLLIAVSDVNEAPVLAEGAALVAVTVENGTGAAVDLSGLGATDPDGDLTTYALSDTSLAAGFSIVGTDLVVPDDLAEGEYAVEIFATDGALDSDRVSLTVSVGAPGVFVPISIEAEAGVISLAASDATFTQVRDAANPETGGFTGLRPDFSGTGYVDYGNDAGDALTFAITVPVAGAYDLNVRYASNSLRPLDLVINGSAEAAPLAFENTDPDGTGGLEGFDNWVFLTRTVTLSQGENSIVLVIPVGATTGPNLDRIEITAAGTGPIVEADLTADADGNLATAPVTPSVAEADLAAVAFDLSGIDADIVTIEASLNGGEFVDVTPASITEDLTVSLDLSDLAGTDSAIVEFRVTDSSANVASTSTSIEIEGVVVAPFELVIQLENRDGSIVIDDDTGAGEGDALSTQFRDATNTEGVSPGRDDGLWNGYSGTGYMDMGGNVGDAFEFEVNAPAAGTYSFTFRYVQAGGTTPDRPMDLSVNGAEAATIAFSSTGTGAAGWTNWTEVTVEVDLAAGPNTVRLENTIANGPNIDQVTIASLGEIIDGSADEDGDLVVSVDPSVTVADSGTVEFTLTGVDADIVAYEASTDGGFTFATVTPVAGKVALDLSGFPAGSTVEIVFRLTDDAGNLVDTTASVDVVADPVEAFSQTIQLEARDGSVTIFDDTAGGTNNANLTQPRDALNPEEVNADRGPDGLWDGFTGDGYLDMGLNVGDAFAFDIDAPTAGTYTFTFRYAATSDRPMSLSIDGIAAPQIAFPATAAFDDWQEVSIDLDLAAGPNTIRLANVNATGPNLDRVVVTRDGDTVDPGVEPGPRETIRINFQDGAAPKVEGYLVDNFQGFADRGDGLKYGWVTEASVTDGDETDAVAIDGSAYPAIAINERSGGVFDTYDARLTGYAHFDLGGYPARTAWQIELENGFYEVTVSVGDTGGPNDSANRLFIEGALETAWSATDSFKSQLVTATVEVSDGVLTLSAPGGSITEMQYLEIRNLPDLTPDDASAAPADYAAFVDPRAISGVGSTAQTISLAPGDGVRPEGVDPGADIVLGLDVVDGRGGVLLESLQDGSIRLFETLTGAEVAYSANTTAGFDSVTISPVGGLKENTSYTLLIDGARDQGPASTDASREFQKFSTSFTTGEAAEIVDRAVAFVDNVELNGAADGAFGFTSVEMSPDQSQLYVVTISGEIKRWDVNSDGSLDKASEQTFTPGGAFTAEGRGFIGLVFDPEDSNTLWVTDNAAIPLNGRDNGVPDFSGRISKVELGSGGSLEDASMSTYITGLPRSNGDHVTNSLEFRANPEAGQTGEPAFLMYLIQGSNSAMGQADTAWGLRPERLLTAAVMEIDHTRTAPAGGFDVSTEPLPDDGQNRRFADSDGDLKNGGIAISNAQDPTLNGKFLHFDANGVATVREGADASSEVFREFYNPFADDAVLKLFATGQRNAYDLVWHSNGFLYVPTNGSAGGGISPNDPDTLANEQFSHPTQNDYLFRVVEGGYYGHPNPLRDKFILNGGNPTGGTDPNQANGYPVGIQPDPDYDLAGSYSLGTNRSPNGAVEYLSSAFGNSLQNALLFTQYSSGNDVRAVLLGSDGTPVEDFVLQRPNGSTINNYADPLDIIEGANGQLYLITLNRGNGQSQLVRLDPAPGGVVGDTTADEGNDLALLVFDATDPTNVVFQVVGLDDDIQTLSVSFDGGTPQTVTLDGQNRFTADLTGETGPVTATLVVGDGDGNSASDAVTFTPGETPVPQGFYDGDDFTNLDPGSTIIRTLADPTTHESASSTNDSDGDGLNDGFDGDSYVDFGGGAGQKAALDVTVAQAGIYDVVLRMANGGAGQDRPISLTLGDQVVTLASTQTGSFTSWQDFTVQLTLEAGVNQIVFAQLAATGGPNIDSVTVTLDTPIGVPNDGTEIVGGVTFVRYEAENALLEDPVIVEEDRNQSGDFVDYQGPDTETVTWTLSVLEAGSYQLDVLYALAASKGARPLALEVNGTSLGVLPFVGQSNETETDWFPQSTVVTLLQGVNTIALTAPAGVGPNLDYLRVSQQPVDQFAPDYNAIDPTGERMELEQSSDNSTRVVNDSTVEFYFTVAGDGVYAFDLAANSGAPDGQGLTVFLSADGGPAVEIDDSGFPGAGDSGEVTTFAELEAGVQYRLTAISDAPGASAIDYLDVRPAPGDESADIGIQSQDPAFFDNRLHFSWIDNPAENDGSGNPRNVKEDGTVTISNIGTSPLEILDFEIDGPFILPEATADALQGLVLAPGASIDVDVLFNRAAYTPPPGSGNTLDGAQGVVPGTLTIRTNDADNPVATVDLAAFWQPIPEGGWEPNVNEVWELFGFGNEIAGLSKQNGGENSVLNFFDVYLPYDLADTTEVLSSYWKLADGVATAQITQIAAFHGPGGASINIHAPGNKGQNVLNNGHGGDDNQSILPAKASGAFNAFTFGDALIPDGWLGDDIFGINVAGVSSDPTLNLSGPGAPSQAQLDARYPGYTVMDGVVFDPDGNEVPDGYTLRMFQALDGEGNVIENVFLGVMDYTGINYDYNDNMFVIEGVSPVGSGGALSISGLDAAAADVRLVFTNIDNPNNGGGIGGQTFRNVAEITLTNDGIGDLDIAGFSLGGVDAADFVVTGAPGALAAGASRTVTVTFVGSDTANNGAAELRQATLTVESNGFGADPVIQLAGLAQFESEGGEEPTVAQIVEAFGYSTDVAQGQLNGGGTVETVGDEVLLPYLQRLDANSPIEVINLAAFLQQGDVSRLNLHGLDSDSLMQLFAGDDQQGQTVLPDGLVPGSGDTGSVGRVIIDRDEPFGLKVTVDGRPTFAAWTDSEANKADPTLGVNDGGHYIRFFEARDASGQVIAGTYIGIQDYPGGGNFDYNDAMFLVRNVQAYDLTSAEDGNGNGVNDALESDADGDGSVDFFDGDTTPPSGPQTPFNPTDTPWAVDADGLVLSGAQYDDGGQGVAYNDAAGLQGGSTGGRAGSDVEVTAGGAIGWIADGEWLEYTVNVQEAGEHTLVFQSALGSAGGTPRAITAGFDAGMGFYASESANVDFTGGWTTFLPTDALTLDLAAGVQVLRLTFSGGSQDLQSFTLAPVASPVPAQTPFGGVAPVIGAEAVTILANAFDEGGNGVAWNDDPGLEGGPQPQRANTDVELVGGPQDIGYVEAGEWVEYTINVAEAGVYDLSLVAKTPIGGNRIVVSLEDGAELASFALADANGAANNGFGGTAFSATPSQQVTLEAGIQTLRFGFEGQVATNGYLLDFRSFTLDAAEDPTPEPGPAVIGRSGVATFAMTTPDDWITVTFAEAMVDPVIVAGPATTNDDEPGTIRIQNVTSTGFQIQFDEWDYLDGIHPVESVSWLAIERGLHDLGNGLVIEAGSGTGTSSNTTVGLSGNFGGAPVVIAQVTDINDPRALAGRIANVDADSFEFAVEEQELGDYAHGPEGFGWIAVSQGSFGELAAGVTPNSVTHLDYAIDFGAARAGGFLAAMQTVDGPDSATVRTAAVSSTGATVFIEEEQSANSETVHTTEVVGWIALDDNVLLA